MRLSPLPAVLAALAVALVAGCGDESGSGAGSSQQESAGSRGDGALGADARVGTLARADVESPPPAGAVWSAWRVELAPGETLEHRHALSTVYAERGAHTLTAGSGEEAIEPQGGAVVGAGQTHTHRAGAEPSVFWDVLLDAPRTSLPAAPEAEQVFETEPLQAIPKRARVAFLDVVLPARGSTTVHTHPGPETIYVVRGSFDYENGIEGATKVQPGDLKSIPPDTAVQKRNPGTGEPRFLSWFIVDPGKAFAPGSEFDAAGG